MTRIEQHKMVELLSDYVHKMHDRDLDDYDVMRKHDRNDKDLDIFARARLSELYIKYVPERLRR